MPLGGAPILIAASDHELFALTDGGQVEIFDTRTRKWRAGKPAPPLQSPGGAAVDGKVVLFGLQCADRCGPSTATVGMAVYDTKADAWTTKDPSLGETSVESFGAGGLGTAPSGAIVGTSPELVEVGRDLSVRKLPHFPPHYGNVCLVGDRLFALMNLSVGPQPGQVVSSLEMDLQSLDLTKPDAWSVVEGSSTKGIFPPDTQLAGALCDGKRGLVLVGGGSALVFDGLWMPLAEGLPTGERFGQGVTTSDGRLFAVADSGVVEIRDAGVRNVAPRPDGSLSPGGVTLIAVGTHVLRFTPSTGGRTPSVEMIA